MINELQPLVKTIGDATVIVPLIKDYLDVGVKNDELLVKMAVVIQRHLQRRDVGNEDWNVTKEEIDQLVNEYTEKEDDFKKKTTEADKIKTDVIDKKVEDQNGDIK